MQSGAAAHCIIGGVILPDSARLREKLQEKIKPARREKADALLQLRASRLAEMRDRITPDMLHALDEALAKRANTLKPFKKKGRTGWRNEFIRALHATRAGPALRRMAVHFLLGRAPLCVYRKYGTVSLGPRDKGSGEEDPRPVGAPDPFWRWCVRAGVQVFESHLCRKLAPHQYAIGVSNGAQRMGKATAFDAAQLLRHVWLPPDVKNAFMELDREENVKDMCMVHPMAGTMTLALYTVPTVYVHDSRGAEPRKYPTTDGVIQGCPTGMHNFCASQDKPIDWICTTLRAAGRGHVRITDEFKDPPPQEVQHFMHGWLQENRIDKPTPESSVVVHRHYANNGAYGVVPELARNLPALAAKCMEVKGLQYKPVWEAWSPSEFSLEDSDSVLFDVKKPGEGLVLAGGECGPIDETIIIGNDNYIQLKLKKKALKIKGYLKTLVSVVERAARAYHVERLAFRVLKQTARSRALYFLRVYSPELTEEASRIVDEAVKTAEATLLGWSEEEAERAFGQASLGFDYGGHDMLGLADDRYLLHLAAWLDSMEELDAESIPEETTGGLQLSRITRKAILEHPRLAPRMEELYSKARKVNATLPPTLEDFLRQTADGERGSFSSSKGRIRWQAALFDGLLKARSDAWLKSAKKNDRDKMKEIAGDWIMAEPPWWTHFQRPTWQIAMRLRYGLPVTPALRDTFLVQRCLAKKKDGSFCLELLDEYGLHAQNCKCEGAAIHRHDSIRDGLVPAMRPMFTSVKIEQFVYELAQLDDNTGETTEARMDIIAETSSLRAMLDIRCFVSTLASG